MTFYERYVDLCEQHGIEPCSQRTADMLHTTRATISTWGKSKAIPRGETVKLIADALNVSTDYLLGRTDDPTNYATHKRTSDHIQPSPDNSNDNLAEYETILNSYKQLDDIDRMRLEAYAEGILTSDKYKKKRANRA